MFHYEWPLRGYAAASPPLATFERQTSTFDVTGTTVAYAQPDTGVRASLSVRPDAITVEVPLGRPPYWGREVQQVLSRLADTWRVEPPALAAPWTAANRSAWQVIGRGDRPVVEDRVLGRWWAWQVGLHERRALYPGAWVAPMRLFEHGGAWRTGAIWTDLGDAVLPVGDCVMVLAAALAARGVTPGLHRVEHQTLARLEGPAPSPEDGWVLSSRASDDRWLAALREAPVVRPATVHPDDAIAASCSRPSD